MAREFYIEERRVGSDAPVLIVAELSANHAGDLALAHATVEAAYRAGADCIKLQTYTADTITLDVRSETFRIRGEPPWGGRYLHDLYSTAAMPWEWHEPLIAQAHSLGMLCFSSPFDSGAVEFLADLNMPAYKIASPEITDIPLIEQVAALGKPMIFSTGVASEDDIVLALNAARAQGNHAIAVLKCTSAYPTAPDQANLRVIASMADRYNVVAGLSDHTLGITAPVAAVSLGAGIIEKHLMLSSDVISEDRHFSLDEFQFKEMVDAVRTTERMLGSYQGLPDPSELEAHRYRRSLFVSRDIHAGERLTRDNIRSVRPGVGLHPKHLPVILNRQAARDLRKGTPLEATAVLGFSV